MKNRGAFSVRDRRRRVGFDELFTRCTSSSSYTNDYCARSNGGRTSYASKETTVTFLIKDNFFFFWGGGGGPKTSRPVFVGTIMSRRHEPRRSRAVRAC